MIKILADKNLYQLEKFLPENCEAITYNPQKPIPLNIQPNVWLLNTVTKVNPTTFPKLPDSLEFLGTGSSGSDHVDIAFLSSNSIHFDDAKGCNARAVAEYVTTSLLLLREEKGVDFQSMKIGIIGVGAVGTQVDQQLSKFGCTTVLYDPPREERDINFRSASLKEILDCDILTFHTPLILDGDHPTYHWLDEKKLANQKFEVIINSARGGVTNEAALLHSYHAGNIKYVITDVWEKEPDFNPDLADCSFIATPHIAGYSEQAKLNASRIICEKCCSFFDLKSLGNGSAYPSTKAEISDIPRSFSSLLTEINPIKKYDADLRDIQDKPQKTALFPRLRNDRKFRFEYGYLEFDELVTKKFPELKLLMK